MIPTGCRAFLVLVFGLLLSACAPQEPPAAAASLGGKILSARDFREPLDANSFRRIVGLYSGKPLVIVFDKPDGSPDAGVVAELIGAERTGEIKLIFFVDGDTTGVHAASGCDAYPAGPAARAYKIRTWPTVYFVGRDGEHLPGTPLIGRQPRSRYEKFVSGLLGKKPVYIP